MTTAPAPTTRYVRVDGCLKPIPELSEPIIISKAATTPLDRSTLAQEAQNALSGLLASEITSDALAALLSAICDALPDLRNRSSQRDARDEAISQHPTLGPAIRRAVRKLGMQHRDYLATKDATKPSANI